MDLLIQAARAAEKQLNRKLQELNLTWPQFEVLRMVRDSGGANLGRIADEIGCSRGNLTGIADRLERDGRRRWMTSMRLKARC